MTIITSSVIVRLSLATIVLTPFVLAYLFIKDVKVLRKEDSSEDKTQ